MQELTEYDARQLWRELRLSENALRYHSDVMAGVAAWAVQQDLNLSVGPKTTRPDIIASRPPICYPPWPCTIMIAEAKDALQRLRDYVNWLTATCGDLLNAAEAQGLTEITFTSTQFVAYPPMTEGVGSSAMFKAKAQEGQSATGAPPPVLPPR